MEEGVARGLPPVLDTAGVAELLGLSRRSVLLMVRDGRLPALRVPGGRKYQFLTEEVVAALRRRNDDPGQLTLDDLGEGQVVESQVMSPAPDVDPCDVWGVAPAARGPGWAGRCLDQWLALACDAGLPAMCLSAPSPDTSGPCVGVVSVDELTYRVLAGPRKRARLVDDEGDLRWGFVDSVWAEPVSDVG